MTGRPDPDGEDEIWYKTVIRFLMYEDLGVVFRVVTLPPSKSQLMWIGAQLEFFWFELADIPVHLVTKWIEEGQV